MNVVETPDFNEAKTKGYRALKVWQKAMTLTDEIYRLTRTFPKDEMFGLTGQLRRAAVSVPSNIAEGSMRVNHKERIQFLNIARGSTAEIETQILISMRQGYSTEIHTKLLLALTDEISRMLMRMMQSLKQ